MRFMRILAIITVLLLPGLTEVVHPAEAGQTAQQLERKIKDSLGGRDLRRIEIAVLGNEATLSGQVPHFWAKDQAIKRALDVDGIETVVSELELPEGESDNDIAEDIAKAIQRYAHYTMWDHITGRVNGGNVSLGGRVTPDRTKADDLFERVAKIKGVQDVQNDILTLPPSQSDRNLRRLIARQLFSNTHFERFATMVNPPFHIVVHNGIIENYLDLKHQLEQDGHRFETETDTEVVAHLVEQKMRDDGLENAVRRALLQLRGLFGLVFVSADDPEKITKTPAANVALNPFSSKIDV